MSALKKYLTTREAYYFSYEKDGEIWERHYYDDLLLLPFLQEDVRMKIIHNALDEGELVHTIDMLHTMTYNYNLDKFKEELEPKFFKRLSDMDKQFFFNDRQKIDQWNVIVSSVFPGNDKLLIPIKDAHKIPEPSNRKPVNLEKYINLTDEEWILLIDDKSGLVPF